MPVLENQRHEQFCRSIAEGKTCSQSYRDGFGQKKAAAAAGVRLLQNVKVRSRVQEIAEQATTALLGVMIRHKAQRLDELDFTYTLMQQVVMERAEDPSMEDVPGGTTGIVVRVKRKVGDEIVDEYQVDTKLLAEMRENRKQVAQECGEWMEKVFVQQVDNEQARLLADIFTVEELEDFKERVKRLREREKAGELGSRANPLELVASPTAEEVPAPVEAEVKTNGHASAYAPRFSFSGEAKPDPEPEKPEAEGNGWKNGQDHDE